jgi:integrase/recombinase XerD
MDFTGYLKRKYNYAERTLQEKADQLGNWKDLCLQSQKLEKLTAKELLILIEILKKKYKIQTLNNHLKTLEQYYNYLVETKKRKIHPLKNFRIKQDSKPLLQSLFTEKELTEIYNNYTAKGHYSGQFDVYKQRNKVILGLMIYQGADSGTLEKLQTRDIDLQAGKIKIPRASDYKLNARTLTLESSQILELHTYLTQTRKKLLKLVKSEKSTKKLFPKSSKTNFSGITQAIKRQTALENVLQLRYSRITIWKKQYNLRETQYKAGYKSLLSLEKFNQEELEELKQAVEKYHPIG